MNGLGRSKRALMRMEKKRDAALVELRGPEMDIHEFGRRWAEWEAELMPLRAEYEGERSAYWRQKALSKLVELPVMFELDDRHPGGRSLTDYWKDDGWTGAVILSDKGVAYIRTAAREETLASLELWFKFGLIFVPAGTVLVIGLLNVCW